MRKINGGWMFPAVAVLAAAVAALPGARSARGQGSQVGELGAGGTALGDISKSAGEEDRIGIDLAAGATLTAKLTADFAADVVLLAPDDGASGAAFAGSSALAAWTVPAAGKYHFRVRSADGTQGAYTLVATQSWPAKVTLSGASGGSVSVALPAGASVKGTVSAMPGSTWDPSIAAFMSPGGVNLLGSPVAGSRGVARLPKTAIAASGLHTISVAGGAAGGAFQATLTVKAKKTKPAKVDLRNGLTALSYAQDGVARLMSDHGCVGCHAWAATYPGVKQFANLALPRIKTGQMPAGGPRLSASEVSLFQQWIATGMNP